MRLSGSLHGLFTLLALGLVIYGLTIVIAIRRGVWFTPDLRPRLWRANGYRGTATVSE